MIRLDEQYVDPRLMALYDIENSCGVDTGFQLGLAAELGAQSILDLGCGTRLLTRELAAPGRRVVEVDPAPATLAFARWQPGAERVQWVEGDANALSAAGTDLMVMTGNVAQVFLDDAERLATLAAIHVALRPGGYLAFESRDPEDRAWQQWNRAARYAKFDSPNGPMESWVELVSVGDGEVCLEGHNVFPATGESVVVKSALRFRSLEELTRTLSDSGFTGSRYTKTGPHGRYAARVAS